MPTYEYRCERGHLFDVMQRMSDDPVTACTECEAPVQRVFHPFAVHFKGSGFYNTDYGKAGSSGNSDRSGEKSGESSSSGGESSSSGEGSGSSGSSDGESKKATKDGAGTAAKAGSGSGSSGGDSKSGGGSGASG